MKITYRIPMNDPYAYIEMEGEEDSFEEAYVNYQGYMAMVKGGGGLPAKDFDQFVQNQLMGQDNKIEDMEKMSQDQLKTMQIIKRALNRIEYANR